MRHDEFEERRARRVQRARRAGAGPTGPVPWAPVAGGILLLITGVLTASQWELVAATTTGRSNSFRDGGLSILLGLGGVHLLVAPGRHRITAAVVALAGIGLVLGGLVAGHDHAGLAVMEVAAGVLAVLCALAALARPTPHKPDPAVEVSGSGGTRQVRGPGR